MAKIPQWLLGRHITAITIALCTVAADGTVTVLSATSLSGFLNQISLSGEKEKVTIQSIDRYAINTVYTGGGTSMVITELLKTNDSSGTPTNILAASYYTANDYCQIVLTRGSRTFTLYAGMGSYVEEETRGESTGKMTLDPIDAGTTNPVYT